MTRILVLNELHPSEQPGAATIAYDYALGLSAQEKTVFLYTAKTSTKTTIGNLEMVSISRSAFLPKLPTSVRDYAKVFLDLLNLPRALNVLRQINSLRPDQIWIHQIGNDIPRLLVPFLSRRYKVLITLHDFGLIVPRKLYPFDLTDSNLKSLGILANRAPGFKRLKRYIKLSFFFHILRRKILKFYFRNTKLISISALQSEIYMKFGFQISGVVSNGIDFCNCNSLTSLTRNNGVLFVGRLIGKGFPRLLRSAQRDAFKLRVVGDADIESYLSENDITRHATYMGKLSRNEVIAEMHKVMFVYVASDCFDVYPTVGLEAIRHGAIPITSNTTGIRDLVKRIDNSLILEVGEEVFSLSKLFDFFVKNYPKEQIEKVNSQINSVSDALEEYSNLI